MQSSYYQAIIVVSSFSQLQLQIHWFDVCVLRTSIDSWWSGEKKDEEMQKENLIADKLRGNGILENLQLNLNQCLENDQNAVQFQDLVYVGLNISMKLECKD